MTDMMFGGTIVVIMCVCLVVYTLLLLAGWADEDE